MSPRRDNRSATGAVNVVKFIELMKQYPIPPGRQSRVEVDETWKLLAREMGVARNVLMTKWRNLVITYRRELRLQLAVGEQYVSRWPHFKAMSFLRHDILSKMKTNPTKRPAGNAVGEIGAGGGPIACKQRAPGQSMEEELSCTSELTADCGPYPEQDISALDVNDFPVADVSSIRVECAMSGPVYEFLMLRIYPYVAVLPDAAQMAILAKMQQLVFEEYETKRTEQ